MRTILNALFGAALVALAGASVALADNNGAIVGRVLTSAGVVAAPSEMSFIAYVDGKDDIIHTENAFNSAMGLRQGYIVNNNQGVFLVNFANFTNARPGQPFTVVLTGPNNERGQFASQVPDGLTNVETPVQLQRMALPTTPSNLQVQRSAQGVSVSWNATAGLTYRVYRAELPSGADNGASRGIYSRIAQGVTTGSFVDANTAANLPYWYLVVAEDKAGVISAHSGEVRALPVGAPQIAKPEQIAQPKVVGGETAPAVTGGKIAR